MSEYSSPAQVARDAIEDRWADESETDAPEWLVDEIFLRLKEPDGDMIRAGLREIADSRGKPPREVVCAIWSAMIRAAQS